jgi:hypothetical protein
MRTILSFFILILFSIQVLAQNQVPNKFNYQAVLRNANGELMANQSDLNVNVKIYAGSPAPENLVFSENHSGITTNSNGLFSIIIGMGNPELGNLIDLNWNNMTYSPRLVVEVLGMQLETMMNSVPFAMYSYRVQYYQEDDPHYFNSPASSITNSGSGSVITTAERAGLHTHSNSGVLNAINNAGSGAIITTAERDGLHTHANSGVLNALTNAGSGAIITTAERDGLHTHANSGVLNAITNAGSGAIITTAERTKLDNVAMYSVGDFAYGGIVFYVEPCGTKGLVAAKVNSGSLRWYAGTYGYAQAKGDGPYAGKANTSIIIAALVAIGDDGSTYAARYCNELKRIEGSKAYADWYLPSKEELGLMYENRAIINATSTANGGQTFLSTSYWSSTEHNEYYSDAWTINFADGTENRQMKENVYRVRAVRRF